MNVHRADSIFLLIVFSLVVFGLIVLSSASTVIGHQEFGDSAYFLKRQFLSVLIGVLLFAITYRLDYRVWRKFAFPFLIISMALLVAVFVPGIGLKLLGAQRWINVGLFTFQPAEIVKLTFLVYLARWLEDRGRVMTDRAYGLWPFLLLVGAIAFLVMKQPDVGTMVIIGIIALSSYWVAGAPFKDIALILLLAAGFFALVVQTASYRAARFLVFLNPQYDPQGVGYHINQALLAIGSGGLFGLGLGHSRQKFNYLPEAQGDSIFAVVAEELGFFIVLALLVLFVAFMLRGYRIARQAPDSFGKVLAAGITTWLGFQALINVAALSGIIPLTGVPLPFISYGGTAMMSSLAAVGILANISRAGNLRP